MKYGTHTHFITAGKATLKQLGLGLAFLLGVVILMGVFYMIFIGARFLFEKLSLIDWFVLSAITAILVLFGINYFRLSLEAGASRKWRENDGNKPPFKKVSIKCLSGNVIFSIDPDNVDWDLTSTDPVVKYKICR